MLKRTLAGLVLAAVVSSPGILAAKETLIELAKRLAPTPIFIEKQRELIPSSLESTVAGADLIVHGTVTRANTYLSTDQYELFTDYVITPIRFIFQRSVMPTQRPGLPEPIVVTLWGGRTTLEGVDVTLQDKDAPRLETGAEVVLCLRADPSGRYRLVSDITGAIGVIANRLVFLNNEHAYDDAFLELKGASVDQLDRRVQRLKQ